MIFDASAQQLGVLQAVVVVVLLSEGKFSDVTGKHLLDCRNGCEQNHTTMTVTAREKKGKKFHGNSLAQ